MKSLEQAGREALARGIAIWNEGIMEPGGRKQSADPAYADGRKFIDDIIRGPEGLGWSRCSAFVREFRWDGDFEWCGAFAAYCWAPFIDLATRKRYFPSTYRLDRYGRHKRAFAEAVPVVPVEQRRKWLDMSTATVADIEAFHPRAGDILIVNGTGYGQHITIVERWNRALGSFSTVEGNATGNGPQGQRYQGVVIQTRAHNVCRRLIRPGLCDLIQGAP